MEYTILICTDCTEEFVFTEDAKQYFLKRGLMDPPRRCKYCYNVWKHSTPHSTTEPAVEQNGK